MTPFQTDSDFPSSIQKYGCYLLSLIERLTTHFDLPFTHDSVISILDYGQTNKFIDDEVTLRDKVRFEGKFERTYLPLDDEFEIVVYHKDGASFNHFCSGNGKGLVLYDPYSAMGSDSVRNGELISKRIYRIA
jgi:hypothetical protein